MKSSKLFFIATVIGIIITIVLISISIYYGVRAYNISGSSTNNEIVEETQEKENFYKYLAVVSGGISIILLTAGIILKIKEKGGIEIVG